MKNRILVFVVAFVTIAFFHVNKLSAQAFPINLGLYPRNIQVSNINGVIAKDVYTLDLQVPYGGNIVESWSIAVRVTSPIELRGTEIPSEKIGIRFNKIAGTGRISLGDVGVDNQTVYKLNHNTPISLINPIRTVLKNDKTYEFHFDIIVEGGNYLAGLHPWEDYPFGLTFYITVGSQTAIIEQGIDFRVSEIEGDNTIPEFGFEVSANAILDFTSPEHFTMQVENEPNSSWIDVVSKNSDYFIKVKTNDPNFQLVRNNAGYEGDSTIPVSVVNVEMDLGNSRYGQSEGSKSLSSTTAEILFRGKKKRNETQRLPVRYFIKKEDAEMLSTKTSGQYITIVTYTLEPN